MAKRKSGTVQDALSMAKDRLDALGNRREELRSELEQVEEQIFALSGVTIPSGKPKRRRRRKANGESSGRRALDPKGRSMSNVIVQDILPDSKSNESMNRDQITEALAKQNIKSEASDPKVVVGQALNKLSKEGLVKRPARGQYKLSAKGDTLREKLNSEPTSKEDSSKNESTAAAKKSPTQRKSSKATSKASAKDAENKDESAKEAA